MATDDDGYGGRTRRRPARRPRGRRRRLSDRAARRLRAAGDAEAQADATLAATPSGRRPPTSSARAGHAGRRSSGRPPSAGTPGGARAPRRAPALGRAYRDVLRRWPGTAARSESSGSESGDTLEIRVRAARLKRSRADARALPIQQGDRPGASRSSSSTIRTAGSPRPSTIASPPRWGASSPCTRACATPCARPRADRKRRAPPRGGAAARRRGPARAPGGRVSQRQELLEAAASCSCAPAPRTPARPASRASRVGRGRRAAREGRAPRGGERRLRGGAALPRRRPLPPARGALAEETRSWC